MITGFKKNIIIFLALFLSAFIIFGFFVFPEDIPLETSRKNFGLAQFLQINDKTPPQIFDIDITNITTSSVTILWKTDEQSDALVNYGLEKDYGIARDAIFGVSHQITLDDLLSGTAYYIRLSSADIFSNQNIVGGYSFTTKGEPMIVKEKTSAAGETKGEKECLEKLETLEKEKTEILKDKELLKGLLEGKGPLSEELLKILEKLEKIESPELSELIISKIEIFSTALDNPPNIIGAPRLEIGTDYVIASWLTDKESNSLVSLAQEGEYDPSKEDPYRWSIGDLEEMVLEHTVRVDGLKPATIYHYQVSSRGGGGFGPAGKSIDRTFATKSVLPEIKNIRIDKVEEYSATISWNTNVPASGIIEYTNLRTKEIKSKGDPIFSAGHSVQITELEFKTSYSAIVKAENTAGEKMSSVPFNFTTTKDEFPPIISKVANESTLYPGAEVKIQTVVGWETDEPSVCQFFYQEGLAGGAKKESFAKEANFTIKHVQVITSFAPSTVYKFWLKCEDKVLNEVKSEDFVLFTPEKEKSIIDIIIENFETAFGWVKKIKR